MIELTQEQVQAIAQQANPTMIDSQSNTEYVVLRKDRYDKLLTIVDDETAPNLPLDAIAAKVAISLTEAEKALALRVIWMRRMGLVEDEITDSLRVDPPVSVDQEMQELIALEKLKTMPSSDILRTIAIKY